MAFIPGNSGTPSTFPDGFQIANGTVTAPTLRFSDTQTGWYRSGLNQMALASNGVQTILVSAAGAVTVGPSVVVATTAQPFNVFGGINSLATGTADAARRLILNTNTHIAGETTRGTRNSNTNTLGGAALQLIARTTDSSNAVIFQTNLAANGDTTDATAIATATQAGAWTLGPASSTNLNLTVNGLALAGAFRVARISSVSGTVNDFALGANGYISTSAGATTFTGIADGVDGRVVYITAASGLTCQINHQDAGSTATNRIITKTGANTSTSGGFTLIYDTNLNRWVQVG